MNLTIRLSHCGGPDVLRAEQAAIPAPAAGEVLLRHTAIGVNFIDTYYRSGLYPLPLPSGLGSEAAGVVAAVGDGVSHLQVGDRVAYAGGAQGAYSQYRTLPAALLVKLPDDIADDTAACVMLQGMTVEYLIRRTYAVEAGQTVLWHAAAGGVGQIAVQWLSSLGVNVIGTVGSADKAAIALRLGCKQVINYREEDVVARVRELTGGRGVPVVYDSVGKDTFERSIECLRPFGMMVSFGNASGLVPPIDFGKMLKGSLFLTRPSLMPYTAKREDLVATAKDLFDIVLSGKVKIEINQRYPLREAAQAHRDLEARKTTGSTILLP